MEKEATGSPGSLGVLAFYAEATWCEHLSSVAHRNREQVVWEPVQGESSNMLPYYKFKLANYTSIKSFGRK